MTFLSPRILFLAPFLLLSIHHPAHASTNLGDDHNEYAQTSSKEQRFLRSSSPVKNAFDQKSISKSNAPKSHNSKLRNLVFTNTTTEQENDQQDENCVNLPSCSSDSDCCSGYYCDESSSCQEDKEVVFYLMADTPYNPSQAILLGEQVGALNAIYGNDGAEFVMHLGDIMKAKTTDCEQIHYMSVDDILSQSDLPVFITPGDNEHNDCPDPDLGLANWTHYFGDYDSIHWSGHGLPVDRMADRRENFAMFLRGVLIISVNIQGGTPYDLDEWKGRHEDNVLWTLSQLEQHRDDLRSVVIFGHGKPSRGKYEPKGHFDYFDPVVEAINDLAIPRDNVRYFCGDIHRFEEFAIADEDSTHFSIIGQAVDNGGHSDPLKVKVDNEGKFHICVSSNCST